MRFWLAPVILVPCFLFLSGCSARGSKITGLVTLDGKALPQASLSFVPAEEGLTGINSARTNDEGKFEVLPNPKTKLTLRPGKYIVYVSKLVDKSGNLPPPEDAAQLEASGALRQAVPLKYTSHPDIPPQIKVEIKKGDTDLKIDLTSK